MPSVIKTKDFDFQEVDIDKIVPNAWNDNEMDAATYTRLKEEIASVGFLNPIQVVPNTSGQYVIIGGEHRWRASKELGFEKLPCTVLTDKKWEDDSLQKFVTTRQNVIHGKTNPEKFIKLYEEMVARHGEESVQHLMGYTDSQAFAKLTTAVKKGMKQALPKGMHAQLDKAVKDAKTVEDLEKIIQTLFNEYGDTLDQSYMIFTYGKQSHIYITMSSRMKKAMDKVFSYCKKSGEDVNEFMFPILLQAEKEATEKLEALPDETDNSEFEA